MFLPLCLVNQFLIAYIGIEFYHDIFCVQPEHKLKKIKRFHFNQNLKSQNLLDGKTIKCYGISITVQKKGDF